MLRRRKKVSSTAKLDRDIQKAAQWNLKNSQVYIKRNGQTGYVGYNGRQTTVQVTTEESITTWDVVRGQKRFIVMHDSEKPFIAKCGEWIETHEAYFIIDVQLRLVGDFIELNLMLAEQERQNAQ